MWPERSFAVLYGGHGFDLDEQFRVEQTGDADEGAGGRPLEVDVLVAHCSDDV